LSSVGLSDGSSSSVKDEPLSPVPWLMPSDSKMVLTVANVSSRIHVQGSGWSQLSSELEESAIWNWWFLPLNNNSEVSSLNNRPTLIGSVVAVPEDNMASVVVVTSMDIQTLTSIISDVSSVTSIDSDSLIDLRSPLSYNSSLTNVESLTSLVRKSEVSSSPGSDGSSS